MSSPRVHLFYYGHEGERIDNEVAAIIDKAFLDGKPEYLVKWKYAAEYTWEPVGNLGNCAELLAEFEERWEGSEDMQENTNRFAAIEKILERRVVNDVTEYRVQWKGGNESNSTWEPEESIIGHALIEDFEEEEQNKSAGVEGVMMGKSGANPPATKEAGPNVYNRKRNLGVEAATERENVGPVSPAKKWKRPGPLSRTTGKVLSAVSSKKMPVPTPTVTSGCGGSDSEANHDDDEPEKILNATDESGELRYLVKYRGKKELGRVPADEIHDKFPKVALAYYLERRAWAVPI